MNLENKVRIIPHRIDNAAYSLSIDRALLRIMDSELTDHGKADPILRTYQFSKPAVVMGYNQKVDGRFDEKLAASMNVDLTVRDTGGGHMYYGTKDIQFAFIAPSDFFEGGLIEKYQAVNSIVVEALKKCGYPARLGRTSIKLFNNNEKLVAGTAQRHASHAFLHHGAILVKPYSEEIFNLLCAREDEKALWDEQVTCLDAIGDNNYSRIPELISCYFPFFYIKELNKEEFFIVEELYEDVFNNKDKIYSGTKNGDLCLIAGERSTKNKEQEVAL